MQEAERLYRAILQSDPGHADANHNLGVLAVSLGKSQAALPFLLKAIETKPDVAQYWITLATVQHNCDQIYAARKTIATARQRGIINEAIDSLEKRLADLQSPDLLNPSQKQIDELTNFYYSGQMFETEQACKALLAQFPRSVFIMNIWGAALSRQNKFHEAIGTYSLAIQLKPDYAEAYNNRGNAFKNFGKHKEAFGDYSKAIQLKPDYAEAYNNRGNAFYDLGKYKEALSDYNKAIQLKSDYAEAYNNRGNAFYDLGKYKEALSDYNKAIQLKPDYAEAYNNRGNAFKDFGRHKEAFDDYNKAIQLKPDYAEAYNNRGNSSYDHGRYREALNDYNKAILIKPDYAEAHNNRGNAFKDLGKHQAALMDYNKAIQLKPDYTEAYSNRGNVFSDLGRYREALNDYNKAIQIKPDYAEAYNNRGNAFKDLGRQKEALDDFNKAIKLKPDCAQAYRNLGTIKNYKKKNPHLQAMKTLYSETKSNVNRMHLSFALAKAFEDMDDYATSFSYLTKGNRLRKRELNYSIGNDRKLIETIKDIFSTGNPCDDIRIQQKSGITPIFILGMPRSGTSLVEQILASHSQVHGAGELPIISNLMQATLSNYSNQRAVLDSTIFLKNEIKKLNIKYIEYLTQLNVYEKIITDKMPNNFFWIGFILSAIPDAKIINVNRDARATCWSIYKHFFSSRGNGYAYDMIDLANFYNLYTNLMIFWHNYFPNKIYDLKYEKLTENQKSETQKLLSFCNLKWEEQCIDFYKTERAVKTASATQVRKKMYKGSSEAWRKFEEYIQPMIDQLDSAK